MPHTNITFPWDVLLLTIISFHHYTIWSIDQGQSENSKILVRLRQAIQWPEEKTGMTELVGETLTSSETLLLLQHLQFCHCCRSIRRCYSVSGTVPSQQNKDLPEIYQQFMRVLNLKFVLLCRSAEISNISTHKHYSYIKVRIWPPIKETVTNSNKLS